MTYYVYNDEGANILTFDAEDLLDARKQAVHYLYWYSASDGKIHTEGFGIFDHEGDAKKAIFNSIAIERA